MSKTSFRKRRALAVLVVFSVLFFAILAKPEFYETQSSPQAAEQIQNIQSELESLEVKGRASKTGYTRAQFGSGWATKDGCDTRNSILYRDLQNSTVNDECKVLTGTLYDPYTAKTISFVRGPDTSDDVQIDHMVALSNAWQTGAQQISFDRREAFANDPLNLLAVDGQANQQKSDGDAATWLPKNKAFRCEYVTRQISVKKKYKLWVVPAEKTAMMRELSKC